MRAEDAAREQEEAEAKAAAIASIKRNAREDTAKAAPSPSMRRPPEGDAQSDFFVPVLYDVATKDSCHSASPVFSRGAVWNPVFIVAALAVSCRA